LLAHNLGSVCDRVAVGFLWVFESSFACWEIEREIWCLAPGTVIRICDFSVSGGSSLDESFHPKKEVLIWYPLLFLFFFGGVG